MISFQANQQTLKSAKLLESKARNTYPHLSTSKIRSQIGYDKPVPSFLYHMNKHYRIFRQMIRESGNYYAALVHSLLSCKMGNCVEDAKLTELLGRINGQDNIYTGCLGIKRDDEPVKYLDHVIAFVTDINVQEGKKYFFKNKDAMIIDPWLNTSNFVSDYFTKLKTIYRERFMNQKDSRFTTFTNDKLAMKFLSEEAKTPKEFKEKRKKYFPHVQFCLVPLARTTLKEENINSIKEIFPELIIKNYKKIELSSKNFVSK